MVQKQKSRSFWPIILISAFQSQLSVGLGLLFCLVISYLYYFLNDPRFPTEQPEILAIGVLASFGFFVAGNWLGRNYEKTQPLNIKQGSITVILAWLIAVGTSSLVFLLAGFPDPSRVQEFSLFRRLVDSIFESVSGFSTAGGSILPSVEIFPRSILLWRSTTQLIGGMGIAYSAATLWDRFLGRREEIFNSETESPNYVNFPSERQARIAGFDFLKIYGLLVGSMITLLFFSGIFFRHVPYPTWHDNLFESVNYAFSAIGTGGFGTHDASAGLPIIENGRNAIGGLRNPTSEWIIAVFMLIAGANFSLWYILIFKGKWKEVLSNTEFQVYLMYVAIIVAAIWSVLVTNNVYENSFDALRYSFFNVASIISTTGLGTSDFTQWPGAAEGLLFSVYLVGGMVGSTAGGLKILRFQVLLLYAKMKIENLIYGRHQTRFSVDGTRYSESASGLIIVNIVLYYLIFLLGGIGIMVLSPVNMFADGSIKPIDFTSAITASIANLGNIGPAVEIGNINAGPTGNYFAYSELAKLLMALLMIIGRLGVLTFLMVCISKSGMIDLDESVTEQNFDSDDPIIRG